MKTPLFRLLALPALAFTCTSLTHADVSAQDKMFVKKAAVGGMFEVESSKVAQSKATNPDVKGFADMMVTDHSKANDELKGIATSKSLTVPDSLDAMHQKMLDTLNSDSGKQFDTDYLADMTKGHKAADALFTKEASAGSDPDLKAFASKTDMVIKHHIAALGEVKSKM
jgi:putative membrane protein